MTSLMCSTGIISSAVGERTPREDFPAQGSVRGLGLARVSASPISMNQVRTLILSALMLRSFR